MITIYDKDAISAIGNFIDADFSKVYRIDYIRFGVFTYSKDNNEHTFKGDFDLDVTIEGKALIYWIHFNEKKTTIIRKFK